MRAEIVSPTPRYFQAKVLDGLRTRKIASFLAPRQTGKTWGVLIVILDFIFRYDKRRNPHCLVAGISHDSVKKLFVEPLLDFLRMLPPTILTVQNNRQQGITTITIKRAWFGDRVTLEIAGVGNPDSLRGRTIDLLIVDELAFMKQSTWGGVLEPTTSAIPTAKTILTSTINGENFFTALIESHRTMMEKGMPVGHYEFDPLTAQCDPFEKIVFDFEYAKHSGKEAFQLYRQERLHDRYAMVLDESPFMKKCNRLMREHLNGVKNFIATGQLFVSVDIGSTGKTNPAIIWRWNGIKPHIIDFNASMIMEELIPWLKKKYNRERIVIFVPWDVEHSAVVTSTTRKQLLQQVINRHGMGKFIKLSVIPKTQDKASLVRAGISFFNMGDYLVDLPECNELIRKLTKATHPKIEKTGFIDSGKFSRKEGMHAAEAVCYMAEAINLNRHRREYFNEHFFQQELSVENSGFHGTYKRRRI